MTTPAGSIRRKNPRLQGEIGLGAAIAWFAREGYGVSIPLCDNRAWDLIVEHPDTGELLRVQVKTATTRKLGTGHFQVGLRTTGGNQSFHTTKDFDNTASDLLFVLTDDREVYVIPCTQIPNRTAIVLGPKWCVYREASESEAGGGRRIRTFVG